MAGLIGAMNRFSMGGWTSIPCSLTTVFAGVFGGAAHRLEKGKLVNFHEALALGIGIELFDEFLVLFLKQPSSEAIHVVYDTIIPQILSNILGFCVFQLIFSHEIEHPI